MSWIGSLLAALFGGLWDKWFPPKTANDQKLDDAERDLKNIKQSEFIKQRINGMSDAELDANLRKWVRRSPE